jgi:preprotein translocase subunit Sec61beta
MDTLKRYFEQAAAWVAANPTETVYAALAVAGLTIITGGRRR